jgi:hypothetical protein
MSNITHSVKYSYKFTFEKSTITPDRNCKYSIKTKKNIILKVQPKYIPRPFWFIHTEGLALPLVSLQALSEPIQLKIKF